jgi:hypothetical protein
VDVKSDGHDRVHYDCFSFGRTDEMFTYYAGEKRPDVQVPIRHQCISNLCPVYDENVHAMYIF